MTEQELEKMLKGDLRQWRKDMGCITQKQAAKLLGMTIKPYQRLESTYSASDKLKGSIALLCNMILSETTKKEQK